MANNDKSFSRVAFETPRVSEYFDQKELTMLCGQPEQICGGAAKRVGRQLILMRPNLRGSRPKLPSRCIGRTVF